MVCPRIRLAPKLDARLRCDIGEVSSGRPAGAGGWGEFLWLCAGEPREVERSGGEFAVFAPVIRWMVGGTFAWSEVVIGAAIAAIIYSIIYPPTPADGTMPSTDIPQEGAQCVANEDGRCEIIREICHSRCVAYFEEGPFPGRDQFAGYRRCMRECMTAHECPYLGDNDGYRTSKKYFGRVGRNV